jgi:hypothetical protein
MSTYRYRGDLRTTGDQLRLRESGSGNKKPVEVRAEDTSEEIILKTPNSAGMDDGAGDDAGKKVDVLTTNKSTQTLENKTINADNNTVSELELDNLKDGVLIDSTELVVSESDNLGDSTDGTYIPADAANTMLLSAIAIKTYVDARDAEQDEASETIYDNSTSGLTATNVQDAIDEVEGRLDTAEGEIVGLGTDKADKTIEIAGDGVSIAGGGDLSENRTIVIADDPVLPGSGAVTIPAGDDAARPASPAAAMIRYNTGTSQVEKYDGTEWSQVGGGGLEVVKATSDISPAEVSTHYLVDTSVSARIITLPASNTLTSADAKRAVIRISDIGENAETNNITINAGAEDTIKMDGEAAASSLIFDVDGTWIQLALSGTTWHVDDTFWNVVSDAYVTETDVSENYYKKTDLDGGQLDNIYYTETEIDDALSLKYDASNPDGFETPTQLNTRDTANRNRSNHTGTQLASTISDFAEQVASNLAVSGPISAHSDVNTAGAAAGNALVYNGSVWVPGVAGASGEVYVHTGNDHGSSATKIRRFTTTQINTGSSITYADSATDGASFTINEDGIYNIVYSDSGTLEISAGVSVNTSSTTTNIENSDMAEWACPVAESIQTNVIINTSATVRLVAGVVIRPHTNGNPDATYGASFRITQVAKL